MKHTNTATFRRSWAPLLVLLTTAVTLGCDQKHSQGPAAPQLITDEAREVDGPEAVIIDLRIGATSSFTLDDTWSVVSSPDDDIVQLDADSVGRAVYDDEDGGGVEPGPIIVRYTLVARGVGSTSLRMAQQGATASKTKSWTIRVKAAAPSETKPSGLLRALQNGDRACNVVLMTDAGELSIEGEFDLCEGGSHDATPLLGQRVTWTTEKAAVQSASCQGDPECTDSETIDVVNTLMPLR